MQEEQGEIKDNQAEQQYEFHAGGDVAVLVYQRTGDRIIYEHTAVPEALEGRGIASKLAKAALEEARAQQLSVVPECQFVRSYIQRHPEYLSLLSEETRRRFYPDLSR